MKTKTKEKIIQLTEERTVDIEPTLSVLSAALGELKKLAARERLQKKAKSTSLDDLYDLLPEVRAGDTAYVAVSADGEPLVQLGAARATTNISLQQFLTAVAEANPEAQVSGEMVYKALQLLQLDKVLSVKATEARDLFPAELEAASETRREGSRTVKVLF